MDQKVIERFITKFTVGDDCWEWSASTTKWGYGQFMLKPGTNRHAHRLSYELFVGLIPEGLHIDHICCNRKCVNPKHLEAVPQQENNRRAAAVRRANPIAPCGHLYSESAATGRRKCNECKKEYDRQRYLKRKNTED